MCGVRGGEVKHFTSCERYVPYTSGRSSEGVAEERGPNLCMAPEGWVLSGHARTAGLTDGESPMKKPALADPMHRDNHTDDTAHGPKSKADGLEMV